MSIIIRFLVPTFPPESKILGIWQINPSPPLRTIQRPWQETPGMADPLPFVCFSPVKPSIFQPPSPGITSIPSITLSLPIPHLISLTRSSSLSSSLSPSQRQVKEERTSEGRRVKKDIKIFPHDHDDKG
jgi:hypothetical protein